MIAFWPQGITAEKGGLTDQVGHVMDFMATAVALAGIEYPKSLKGHQIKPLEGKGLLPVFKGDIGEGRKNLFNEHYGASYVRQGDWKLVKRNNEEWHLYDLSKDKTETNDLAAQRPEKAKKNQIVYGRIGLGHTRSCLNVSIKFERDYQKARLMMLLYGVLRSAAIVCGGICF